MTMMVILTVAICVVKLYDINAELVQDRGFFETLNDLLYNNNPMVVVNAVAALYEIQERHDIVRKQERRLLELQQVKLCSCLLS
ncbi:tubby-like F-box protein 5 [Iris pallida]|uniref:Tubby-like F-box protein 5 n=1 Tax=Iris pallida TaxID=29817 RepID=A0AAX6ETN5_IRIPA|nr:tubby-like F-box protein 5 [Iris pallida]